MNVADTRAALVLLWDGVLAPPGHWPRLDRMADAPAPPGWAVWRAGGEGGPLTALPDLLPSAPLDVRGRYLARVVANTTGRCPMCPAVASITPDSPTPERPGAWHVLPVRVGTTHAPGCPAIFADDDRRHFDPRAFAPQDPA